MTSKLMKAALAFAPAALVMFFTGCTNEELVSNQVTKYEKNFTETFGDLDPNHDWSMATPVTANIDLSNAPEGTYEVKIYSEKNGYLLKKAIVDGSAKLHFDAIKGEKSVRVLARKTSALGLTPINGYFPVENGVVNTTTATRASTADNCETTVGTKLDLGTYTKQGELVYVYRAKNGNVGDGASQTVTTLPNNNYVYYYTKIDGQSYADGSNGNYAVTYNGQQSTMDMYEIGAIISDQSKSQRYYEMTDAQYQYQSANGDYYGTFVTELPSDGKYYITPIAGQSYANGSDGLYQVTRNGSTSQMTMHEISDIIASNNFLMYKAETKLLNSYDASWDPAWNNLPDTEYIGNEWSGYYQRNVTGYSIAGGTYVYPAYYKKTKEAGYTIGQPTTQGAYYEPTSQNVDVKWAGDFYVLNDVYKSVDKETQMPFEDLLPLVSSAYPTPYFHEAEDNRTKWEDDLDFNVELVLTEDGPMTYTYVFYGSIYHNMLGYFYWFETEGMTDAEKKAARIAAPRYVPMNDTWPETVTETGKPNLQCYGDQNGSNAHTPGGMDMPQWVDGGIEAHTGHYLQGTTYHMTYFGENYDQPASYTFPEGAHVAFFLITKATANSTNNNGTNQNTKGNGLFYSIQDMNEDQEVFLNSDGEKCILNNKHWWASQVGNTWDPSQERPDQGEVAAVFYNYKGSMVLGFEDDVDKDENDMLFFISAPINPPHEITDQIDVEMSWVVACEDLGGSYDYDFNDVVFDLGQVDVTYVTTTDEGGTTTSSSSVEKSELYFRPLASGGRRKAYIYYDKNGNENLESSELIGEMHDLLIKDAPYNVPINVGGAWDVDPTTIKPIKLADIDLSNYESTTTPAEYAASVESYVKQELNKIHIVIDNEGTQEATIVRAPNTDATNIAPQMLLLPRGWDWPNEMVSIFSVYPQFKNWTINQEENGWITAPVGSYHTNPVK